MGWSARAPARRMIDAVGSTKGKEVQRIVQRRPCCALQQIWLAHVAFASISTKIGGLRKVRLSAHYRHRRQFPRVIESRLTDIGSQRKNSPLVVARDKRPRKVRSAPHRRHQMQRHEDVPAAGIRLLIQSRWRRAFRVSSRITPNGCRSNRPLRLARIELEDASQQAAAPKGVPPCR